jgi:hypothetical protein
MAPPCCTSYTDALLMEGLKTTMLSCSHGLAHEYIVKIQNKFYKNKGRDLVQGYSQLIAWALL